MNPTPRKVAASWIAAASLGLALFAAGCQQMAQNLNPTPKLDPQKYYAVLLTNGSVYFGKLEGLGAPYLTLRDVFYVQSSTNPETKAVSNVLVKRGKELHAPDMMMINDKSVMFIEPVGAQSKVAQLIEQSKKE